MRKGVWGALLIFFIIAVGVALIAYALGTILSQQGIAKRGLFETSLISESDRVETYVRSFLRATDLSSLQSLYDSGRGQVLLPHEFNANYSVRYGKPYWQIYNRSIPPLPIVQNTFRQKISWASSCYLENYFDAYKAFSESPDFEVDFFDVPLLGVMEFTDGEISLVGVEDMNFHRFSVVEDRTIDIGRKFRPYSDLDTVIWSIVEVAGVMIDTDQLGECIRNETLLCRQDDFTLDEANDALKALAEDLGGFQCVGMSNESCEDYTGDNNNNGGIDVGDIGNCGMRGCDINYSLDPLDPPYLICNGTAWCRHHINEDECNDHDCAWANISVILEIPEPYGYRTVGGGRPVRAIINVSIYDASNNDYVFYSFPDDNLKVEYTGVNFLAKAGDPGDDWDQTQASSLTDFDNCSDYSGLGVISPKDTDEICRFLNATPSYCVDHDVHDVNYDGKVENRDMFICSPHFNDPSWVYPECDVNYDGWILMDDLADILANIGSPPKNCTDFTGTYNDMCEEEGGKILYEYKCHSSTEDICYYEKIICPKECENGACPMCKNNTITCYTDDECCSGYCAEDWNGEKFCCDPGQCANDASCYDPGTRLDSDSQLCQNNGTWSECEGSVNCTQITAGGSMYYCHPLVLTWNVGSSDKIDCGVCKRCAFGACIGNYTDGDQDNLNPGLCNQQSEECIEGVCVGDCQESGENCNVSEDCCSNLFCRSDYDGDGSWCCSMTQCGHDQTCYDEGSLLSSWACCLLFGGWIECTQDLVCNTRGCPGIGPSQGVIFCDADQTWKVGNGENVDIGTCHKCVGGNNESYENGEQDNTLPGLCNQAGYVCWDGECCKTEGESCGMDKECCSKNCEGGVCVGDCQESGESCTESSECCDPLYCTSDYDGDGSWCCDLLHCAHDQTCYIEGSLLSSWACCFLFGGWIECTQGLVCKTRGCPFFVGVQGVIFCDADQTWKVGNGENVDIGTCHKCVGGNNESYENGEQDNTLPGLCNQAGYVCWDGECCKTEGESCGMDKECCSKNCEGGVCVLGPCSLDSINIAPDCSGGRNETCEPGEYINVRVEFHGNCYLPARVQIDVNDTYNTCTIGDQDKGDCGPNMYEMTGINVNCSSSPCIASWEIPAIHPDCFNKTEFPVSASIRDNYPCMDNCADWNRCDILDVGLLGGFRFSLQCPPNPCQKLFDFVVSRVGCNCGDACYDPVADIDKDRDIDVGDYGEVSKHCGNQTWCQDTLNDYYNPCCVGIPNDCGTYSQAECSPTCACVWFPYPANECIEVAPLPCGHHDNEDDCTLCGCSWQG